MRMQQKNYAIFGSAFSELPSDFSCPQRKQHIIKERAVTGQAGVLRCTLALSVTYDGCLRRYLSPSSLSHTGLYCLFKSFVSLG